MIEAVFHGHAFVELILPEGSILIDPFVTDNPLVDITLEDLYQKHILAICVTHGHADHVGDTLTLLDHFPDTPCVTIYGLAKYFIKQGYHHAQGFGIGGTYHGELFSCTFFQAIHDGAILDTGLSTLPAGLIIEYAGKRIYHAGDTALTLDMQLLADKQLDLAFLPIGDIYTMGVQDALRAASYIKAKIVVPIHYNTRPKIKADDQLFARELMSNNYAVPKVLKPGQAVILT